MTLADLPLETRCLAAIVVILEDAALDVRGRLEVLGAALWPTAESVNGNETVHTSDEPVKRWSTFDERYYARRCFSDGDTVSEIAEELGVPWKTVNEWCHSRG